MEIIADRRIYSDECISKAVYNLANHYVIRRTLEGAFETLHITPLHAENVTTDIRKHIMEVLNDYKLRQIIENETHDIRTILYVKAFGDIDENNDEL